MSNIAINWAMKQLAGKSGAKFVLFILADHADAEGGSCFPSIKLISKITEQDERTVRRHLDHLEEIGLIERSRVRLRSGRLSNYSYKLVLDEEHKTELQPADNLSKTDKMSNGGQRTICPKPAVKMSALYNPHITPNKKEKRDFVFFENLILQNFDNTEEVKKQIGLCWDYWLAYPEKMPTGDMVAAFRGWMRVSKKISSAGGSSKSSKPARKSYSYDKSGVAAGTSLNSMDRMRVKGFFETGYWLQQWGAKPDQPDCRISPAIIQEFQNQPERQIA